MRETLKSRSAVGFMLLIAAGLGTAIGGDVTVQKGAVTGSQFVDESLVGYWQFSGNEKDSSIYGNHGTPSGQASMLKDVLELDGNGDYISIGDKDSLDFSATESFTYMVWVRATLSMDLWDMPWYKGGASRSTAGYDMELGSGAWMACISDGTGTENSIKTKTFCTAVLNSWVFLAAVVDRGSAQFRIYLNGSQVGSPTPISGFGSVANTKSATIGACSDASCPFKGRIDEVMVFKRALETWEIQQLYEKGNKRYAYYNELFLGTSTLKFGEEASISWDGANLVFDIDEPGGLGYFGSGLSATGYYARTTAYDKSRGPALNFIQDADYYLTNGQIDHSRFYGYTTYNVPDPIYEEIPLYRKRTGNDPGDYIYRDEPPEDMRGWELVTYQEKIWHTKTESALSLSAEIDVLRQALYEMKQENQSLKTELTALKAAIGVK